MLVRAFLFVIFVVAIFVEHAHAGLFG